MDNGDNFAMPYEAPKERESRHLMDCLHSLMPGTTTITMMKMKTVMLAMKDMNTQQVSSIHSFIHSYIQSISHDSQDFHMKAER